MTLDDLWAVGRHFKLRKVVKFFILLALTSTVTPTVCPCYPMAFDKLFQTLGELLVFWILAETQTIYLLNLSSLSNNCVFCNYYILLHSVYIFDYFQFIVLLVLRHMLPILISGAGEYSLTLFTVSLANTVFCLKMKCCLGTCKTNILIFLLHCSYWCWEQLGFFFQFISWLEHSLLSNIDVINRSVYVCLYVRACKYGLYCIFTNHDVYPS